MNVPDLHCHSGFSLLDGMGTPKGIVERAKKLGWPAVAITEHGWMGSASILYKAAIENGLKPIIGCEMYVVPDEALGMKGKEFRDASSHLTVLALSKEGYENLVAWTTFSYQPENFYYKPRISLEAMGNVARHSLHHNVVLSGCLGSELCKFFRNGGDVFGGVSYVDALRSLFPNFYIELHNHRIEKFMGCGFNVYEDVVAEEEKVRAKLLELAKITGCPVVVTNDSHMQSSAQRKAHIAMRAVSWRHRDDDHAGKSTEQIVSRFMPEYFYFGNYMRPMETVLNGSSTAALENVAEIVKEANIVLDPLDKFTYSIPFSGYNDPVEKIRTRCKARLSALVRKHGKDARVRFEMELGAMEPFAHYLLLMSDFIIHARAEGILTNTRGSAANSLLCYCLKIHDIDSLEYGLLFSRFYNPARKKLPDIDIDIEDDRCDDFNSYVIERMNELEGEGQVVQICNYGTFANRSSFRMAASAYGIPKEEIDEITKLLPQMIDSGMVDDEADAYEMLKEEHPELYAVAAEIFDTVKSVGQHACAWLFGTKERPIKEWVPLYLIASSGRLVTQYDWKRSEDFGLVKGDFLRLKTLSVIKRTLRQIGKDVLDLEAIPLDDEETFEMLRKGNTEGVFTLQGKENRRGCIEVEVANVHDVIRTVAIYRPALTREGKNTNYNNRRKGNEAISYPHEVVEECVGDTFGIPVFQEQAMEIAYKVGMSDAEVDELYQAIKVAKGVGRGAKEAFGKIKPKFLKAAGKIMDGDTAIQVWDYVKAFQGYGFNKGHATSYGVLAVRSAYLKCHYPAEFHSALLDVYPQRHKYIAAARSEGFEFIGPDINDSGLGFSFDRETGRIRVGLGRLKGLGPVAVNEIISGRPFSDYEDFKARTTRRAINATKLETLASIGALDSLGISGDADAGRQYEILGFSVDKPKAFRGFKPKHTRARVSRSGWEHLGREKGMELTDGKRSVSKCFWIPKNVKLELKASPWAQVKTYLMEVLDENGIPFHLMVNEDEKAHVKLLKFMVSNCQDMVLCADGKIRMPFLTDGPQGFRFFGITGTWQNEPQVWPEIAQKRWSKVIIAANNLRRTERKAA